MSDGRFKKGNKPWNAGMKGITFVAFILSVVLIGLEIALK